MTYNINDTTSGAKTGTVTTADTGYPPSHSAEAVTKREVFGSDNFYFKMPKTSETKSLFTGLTYDLVYQTNAGTGDPIQLSKVTDLNMNESVGSGKRCSTQDTWCVAAMLNDTTNDDCDVEIGAGPSTMSSGYAYTYKGQSTYPDGSCEAPLQ